MPVPEHIRQTRLKEQQNSQKSTTRKLDDFFGRSDVSGWLMALFILLLILIGIPATYFIVVLVY